MSIVSRTKQKLSYKSTRIWNKICITGYQTEDKSGKPSVQKVKLTPTTQNGHKDAAGFGKRDQSRFGSEHITERKRPVSYDKREEQRPLIQEDKPLEHNVVKNNTTAIKQTELQRDDGRLQKHNELANGTTLEEHLQEESKIARSTRSNIFEINCMRESNTVSSKGLKTGSFRDSLSDERTETELPITSRSEADEDILKVAQPLVPVTGDTFDRCNVELLSKNSPSEQKTRNPSSTVTTTPSRQNKRGLLILLLFLTGKVHVFGNLVQLQLDNTTIVFGETASMSCTLSNITNINETNHAWQWIVTKRNGESHLAAQDSISSDPNKYSPIIKPKELIYQILIFDLNEDDVNSTYRCDIGFASNEEKLTMNPNLFISYPQKNDTNHSLTVANGWLTGKIIFSKIYPSSTLQLLSDGQDITSYYNTSFIRTGENFYEAEINVAIPINQSYCEKNISVIFKDRNIFMQNFAYCRDPNFTKTVNREMVYVSVCLVGGVIIVISVLYIVKMKIYKKQGDDNTDNRKRLSALKAQYKRILIIGKRNNGQPDEPNIV